MSDPSDFLAPRRCLRAPLPEHEAAADLLADAADAVVAGDLDLARDRLRQADMPALFAFARTLMGPVDPDIHRRRPVSRATAMVMKAAGRMPNPAETRALHLRDGWRCRFCGCRVASPRARSAMRASVPGAIPWGESEGYHGAFYALTASVDHILPHSAGGDNQLRNLVTACWSCQFGRGAYTIEELGLSDPLARPPVVDHWDGLGRVLNRGSGVVVAPDNNAAVASRSASPRARTRTGILSASEYFEFLETSEPGSAAPLQAFVESMVEAGIAPEYQRSLVLRSILAPGVAVSAGWISPGGTVYSGDAYYFAEKLGQREIGQRYLDAIAKVAGGIVRRYGNGQREVQGRDGKGLCVASLLRDAGEWKMSVANFVRELRAATAV